MWRPTPACPRTASPAHYSLRRSGWSSRSCSPSPSTISPSPLTWTFSTRAWWPAGSAAPVSCSTLILSLVVQYSLKVMSSKVVKNFKLNNESLILVKVRNIVCRNRNNHLNLYEIFLVAQQLYISFSFSCPSMVCGMQDCGSCAGQWGAEGSWEGAPKPNQNLKSIPNQTKRI